MARNFVSVRIEPVGLKKAKGQHAHDLRRKVPKYVKGEPDYTILFWDKKEPEDWCQEQDALYYARPRKWGRYTARVHLRKDSRMAIRGIITFGDDVNPEKNLKAFDQKALELVNRIAERWKVKLRLLIRHNDEQKVHYHFVLDYVKRDGSHVLREELTPGELSRLQDLAGEIFASLGLRRGLRKREKLQFLDWLKERLDLDHSTISAIRRQLLNVRRTVKEIHEGLPEDVVRLERLRDTFEKLVQGREVSKEEIAELAGEIARGDIRDAKRFLEIALELKASLDRLRDLEEEASYLFYRLDEIEEALREGRPAQLPKDLPQGSLWDRLRTYVLRYEDARKKLSNLFEQTKALEAENRKKEAAIKALRSYYLRLETLQKELLSPQKLAEEVDRLREKSRDILSFNRDVFISEVRKLIAQAFKSLWDVKKKLEKENQKLKEQLKSLESSNRRAWMQVQGLEELIRNLEKENRDLKESLKAWLDFYNNPQALKRRLKELEQERQREEPAVFVENSVF